MRRILFFLFTFLLAVSVCSHAQVTPSAYRGQISLTAGGFASAFQPDYAGGGVPGTSPYRLYGFGAYADLKMTRSLPLAAPPRPPPPPPPPPITHAPHLSPPPLPLPHLHPLRPPP